MNTRKRKMTKQQLVREIAKRANVTHQLTVEIFEHLRDIALEELNSFKIFVIPELVKLTLKDVPAKPERPVYSPFAKKMVMAKAAPASKKVKAKPERALRESVA